MKNSRTAPQTAEISLAKQQPTRVQLYCPDFDNGMKTKVPYQTGIAIGLYCPDFDNGMKTLQLYINYAASRVLYCPDFDNVMKTTVNFKFWKPSIVVLPGL